VYNGLTVDEMVKRYSKALHAEAEAQRRQATLEMRQAQLTGAFKAKALEEFDPKAPQWRLDLAVEGRLLKLGFYGELLAEVNDAQHRRNVARARVKVYELVLSFVDPDQARRERITERMFAIMEMRARE